VNLFDAWGVARRRREKDRMPAAATERPKDRADQSEKNVS